MYVIYIYVYIYVCNIYICMYNIYNIYILYIYTHIGYTKLMDMLTDFFSGSFFSVRQR